MQRSKFLKSSLLAASALASGASLQAAQKPANQKALFELREYEMHFATNENDLHNYFEHALIPALNKYGVKNVGVFKELSKSEPAKIYLLIAYSSWEDYPLVNMQVKSDEDFKKTSADYMKLPPEKIPFTRYISKLMIAFDGLSQLAVPAKEPRIFEMRTYEGANEDALRRKIKMFNEEEFKIFYRTKLNPVFFGEVIAGKDLPCLTYMITFRNMEERDKNWADFGADADWKRVSALPEYANTVSRITKIFLEPLTCSQV
jgi:NIPSNAP protein